MWDNLVDSFVTWLIVSGLILLGIGGMFAIDWLTRVVSVTVVVTP